MGWGLDFLKKLNLENLLKRVFNLFLIFGKYNYLLYLFNILFFLKIFWVCRCMKVLNYLELFVFCFFLLVVDCN